MIEDSIILRVVMFLMLSDLRSTILLSMFVSISNFTVPILVPTLLLTPIFSRRPSKYVVSEKILFPC